MGTTSAHPSAKEQSQVRLRAVFAQALAALRAGRPATAERQLREVQAAAPGFLQARTDLARAYREDGRLEAAREELRTVVAAAPGLDSAWLAYGDVLVDLEKYPDAQVAYERARWSTQCSARLYGAGVAMLSSALTSDRATAVNIEIMRSFVRIRRSLEADRSLARKFDRLERKRASHDQSIVGILSAVRQVMNPPTPKRHGIGFTAKLGE